MTKQVAYKVLSEFWCWYGDVEKTVSRIADDEQKLAALDEVGKHSFDGLPLPSLDAKFYICGKEFEVRDALLLATLTVEQVANDYPDSPDRWSAIEDVRDFALGFFNGVIRGMLNK
jgi:hypothetical protein